MHEHRVVGCLNLVYIAKAMPIKEAAIRYLPAMQCVIDKIEAGLDTEASD
jgi:IclR family mhp operon transcriptional activator